MLWKNQQEETKMGKRIAAFFILLLSLALPAQAEGLITFGGGAERSVTAADGFTPIDHLFGSNLAITPGERLEDGLCVAPGADTRLFLRCQGVPEALAALRLTVTGEGPIYDGPLGNADWIYLGQFAAGSRQLLTLILTVPEDLSPEAAPGWTELSWQLFAESADQPQTADPAHPWAAAAAGAVTGLALASLLRRRRG